MRRLFFLVLILAAVLIAPVSADTWAGGFPRNYSQIISEAPVSDQYVGTPFVVSHNDIDLRGDTYGDEPMVIFYVDYRPDITQSTEFDITLADNSVVSGNFTFVTNMILFVAYSHTITLNLESETTTFTTPATQGNTIAIYPVKSDVDPSITGLVMFSKGMTVPFSENDDFVFYPCPVRTSPMIAIETSNPEMDAGIYGGPVGAYYEGEAYIDFWGNIDAIKNFVFGFLGDIYFFLTGSLYWFNLIFIQNFTLLLALYEAIGLALAAGTAKDIFDFIKKAWKVQKSFVDLFMFFVRLIEEIIIAAKDIIFRWV